MTAFEVAIAFFFDDVDDSEGAAFLVRGEVGGMDAGVDNFVNHLLEFLADAGAGEVAVFANAGTLGHLGQEETEKGKLGLEGGVTNGLESRVAMGGSVMKKVRVVGDAVGAEVVSMGGGVGGIVVRVPVAQVLILQLEDNAGI